MTRDNRSRRRDVRSYMAEHGVSYTAALRAVTTGLVDQAPAAATSTGSTRTSSLKPRLYDQGGPRLPAVFTPEHDVNPVCGHFLGDRCDGCGTCTTCDGCYCAVARWEAEEDAYRNQLEREHAEHYGKPDRECSSCELERVESKDYTECPRCKRTLDGYGHYLDHHPPVCLPDKPHGRDVDWSHLIGKRITINNSWLYHGEKARDASTLTGTVLGRWHQPGTGKVTDFYELQFDPGTSPMRDYSTTPFTPREWNITVHDA